MAVIRLFLLLVVLGGLTLLLVQNFSPAISLTFLGMKTQPLPLAIWILFSTAAGAFTSLFITSLFKLSNYFAAGRQTRLKSPATYKSDNSSRKVESRRPEPPPSSGGSGKTESRNEVDDDWDTDNSTDDWDFDSRQNTKRQETGGEPDRTSSTSSQKTQGRQQESKRNSDGSYSYSYNEPKNSGVGKTESIYDADYKVIIPPYQPSTAERAEDDDWGFLDDDDEDKDKRSSR